MAVVVVEEVVEWGVEEEGVGTETIPSLVKRSGLPKALLKV